MNSPQNNKMNLMQEFEAVSNDIRLVLDQQPSHPNALEFYALYKQATVGDINIARPSLFNFRGKAKWDSWNAKKGLSQDQAKEQYIALGKNILEEIMTQSLDLLTMAQTVKNVLPQVPIDVIRRELTITNDVDETITRLLDGTVYYDLETEILPSVQVEETLTVEEVKLEEVKEEIPLKDSVKEKKSDVESEIAKKVDIVLNTISPMTFSTKADSFERDPQLRMKSYKERKEKLLEVARAHYIEKHGLDSK